MEGVDRIIRWIMVDGLIIHVRTIGSRLDCWFVFDLRIKSSWNIRNIWEPVKMKNRWNDNVTNSNHNQCLVHYYYYLSWSQMKMKADCTCPGELWRPSIDIEHANVKKILSTSGRKLRDSFELKYKNAPRNIIKSK